MKIKIFRKRANSLPIILVLFRVLLVPLITVFILYSKFTAALGFFLLTIVVMLIDDAVAKKSIVRSHLRSILDPVADKLLINCSLISLALTNHIPYWIMFLVLGRDVLILLGGAIILYRNKYAYFKSTHFEGITFFLQSVMVVSILVDKADWILMLAVVVMTVISGIYTFYKSELRPRKTFKIRKVDYDAYRLWTLLKPADFITLLNAVSGLAAILFAINNMFNLSAVLMITAVIFDWLDGKVARLTHKQHKFGKELDSLADTISFGVAPAVFGFSLIQTNIAIVAFITFLFAGILRLAKYNIADFTGAYSGMPITFNGIIVPLMYFLRLDARFYPYIYIILAILMVSPFKIKKVI